MSDAGVMLKLVHASVRLVVVVGGEGDLNDGTGHGDVRLGSMARGYSEGRN